MKRFIIPLLVITPLALFGVAIAGSHGGPDGHHKGFGPGGHRGGPPIEMIASHLGLDEGQTAELEALKSGLFERDELREGHEGFRKAAAAELSSDTPDFDKLATLATAQAEAMHAHHLDAIAGIADFAETLTPEQRAKVAEHLENGPSHHRR